MNTPRVSNLILVLITAAAFSGCQTHPDRYSAMKRRLKESYQNGDITREEYDEALGRYRQSAKGRTTQESENDFSF